MDSNMKCTALVILVCGISMATVAATITTTPGGRKPAGPKPTPDGSRFLFVMDTSSSMKSISDAERQTLFDLVFSGVNGYMSTGDTFGVWTYGEEVGVGKFPMQVWDADTAVELASRATKFIRDQEYAGNNQIEELMPKLTAVIHAVSNLNIFIIS